jgi:hypothetical protein
MEERKVKIVDKLTLLLALIFASFIATGCGTLRNGRGWGQDAIYPLDLRRIPRAAYHAFFDLETLVPAAGAAVFTIDNYDRKVSDWARKHTPIFGSNKAAENAYTPLETSLKYEWLVTVFATPSGENPKDIVLSKVKGWAVGWAAQQAASGTASFINDQTGRIRPDGSDNRSFPSSGSTNAFTYSTLANRNLDSIPVPQEVKVPLKIANIFLATTVAWSRIEAGKHYPSDVLIGAALGHFITALMYDAFMGLPEDGRFSLYVSPSKHERMIGLTFVF